MMFTGLQRQSLVLKHSAELPHRPFVQDWPWNGLNF